MIKTQSVFITYFLHISNIKPFKNPLKQNHNPIYAFIKCYMFFFFWNWDHPIILCPNSWLTLTLHYIIILLSSSLLLLQNEKHKRRESIEEHLVPVSETISHYKTRREIRNKTLSKCDFNRLQSANVILNEHCAFNVDRYLSLKGWW